MSRIARVIATGLPHHVTQRGNRRQQTFFCDEDYQEYIGLMAANNLGLALFEFSGDARCLFHIAIKMT